MLNHSRFPDGMPLPFMPAQSSRRARGAPTARFAVRLRVALRFAQQPTGLTLPSGAPNPCAAAQNASVASGPRPQETRLSAPPTIPRTTSRHPYTLGYIPTHTKRRGLSAPPFVSLATSRVSCSLTVARNAHALCCGTGSWGAAPNPGKGLRPLHPTHLPLHPCTPAPLTSPSSSSAPRAPAGTPSPRRRSPYPRTRTSCTTPSTQTASSPCPRRTPRRTPRP